MTEVIDTTLLREFHDNDRPYVVLRLPSREEIARVIHDEQCGCPLDDESLAAHREHQLDPIQYPHFSHLADAVLATLRRAAQTRTELDDRLNSVRDRESAHQRQGIDGGRTADWHREHADLCHEIALIYGTAGAILPATTVAGRAAIDACLWWQELARKARERALERQG